MKIYYQKTIIDGSLNFGFHEIESVDEGKHAISSILDLYLNTQIVTDNWRADLAEINSIDDLECYMEDTFQCNNDFYYCQLNSGWFRPSEANYLVVYNSYSDYNSDIESYFFAQNGRYAMTQSEYLRSRAFYCNQSEVYFSKISGDNSWYTTGDGFIVHEECTDDLTWHEYTDQYYFHEYNVPEDEDEEDEEDDTVYLDGYHSRNSEYLELDDTYDTPYKIGFEAEKEDFDIKTIISLYQFNKTTDFMWRKERDSSLSDHEGFELISPFMKLDTDRIISYINGNSTLVEHINASANKKCGGHVHLSHRNLSGSELYDTISGYFPIILAMYRGRIRNSHSAAGSKDDMKRGGRMAINVKSDRIEIRVFSAIKSVDQLKFRLKLLQFICSKPTEDFKTAVENIRAGYKKIFSSIYDRQQFSGMLERSKVYSVDFEFATSEEINN